MRKQISLQTMLQQQSILSQVADLNNAACREGSPYTYTVHFMESACSVVRWVNSQDGHRSPADDKTVTWHHSNDKELNRLLSFLDGELRLICGKEEEPTEDDLNDNYIDNCIEDMILERLGVFTV